ncbi:MAG: DNA-binding protein [Verrucomicrobia bacterium]|nr:DNA-binding protein [Verrucomicrobiota bacterium]
MANKERWIWIAIVCVLLAAGGTYFFFSQRSASPALSGIGISGFVASARYSENGKSQPTFLNLGKPYPNQDFTVVIWGSDRENFKEPPEKFYLHKNITVTGEVTTYRGKPEIIVHDPSQITVK